MRAPSFPTTQKVTAWARAQPIGRPGRGRARNAVPERQTTRRSRRMGCEATASRSGSHEVPLDPAGDRLADVVHEPWRQALEVPERLGAGGHDDDGPVASNFVERLAGEPIGGGRLLSHGGQVLTR